MKQLFKLSTLFLLLAIPFMGCDDDDEKPVVALEATTVSDLQSVGSKFVLYSFSKNAVIPNADSATTQWDIGFRNTTIILNGGTSGPGRAAGQIVEGIFDELNEAPADGYLVDGNEKAIKGSGWYTYTGQAPSGPQHAVLPIAGKILVLKTADDKYVKVEMLSYYKGNPNTATAEFASLATRPASPFYTFRFIYQPDGTSNFKTTTGQ